MAFQNVTGYILKITKLPQTDPPVFNPNALFQVEPNGAFTGMLITSLEEFLAIAALIQTPGRLQFDSEGLSLQKIQP
jgi:hypothetical protein